MTEQLRYASLIAKVDGVDREVVAERQPVVGWAEPEGYDMIRLHLSGPPVGPIETAGVDLRVAIFAEKTGGNWLVLMSVGGGAIVGRSVRLPS